MEKNSKAAAAAATAANRRGFFQMPVHYPRYTKEDYLGMPEAMLDRLFAEYGLSISGDLTFKRDFAIGTFLWPTLINS